VLVKPGRREVDKIYFIEPTTGTIYPAASSNDHPYLHVESVWSEHNYWANVQRGSMNEMIWDLAREDCWEYVLIDEEQLGEKDEYHRAVATAEAKESADKLDSRDILDAPVSWCDPIRIDRATFINRFPKGFKTIQYKKALLERFSLSY